MALIFVIDDEYLLATLLGDILEDEGHEVVLAPNGRVALERVRERRPALVITDFMMPVMTGLEFAQALQADAEIGPIPVILVSGAQGALAREHPELFHAVLDKPYDNARLIDEVEKALGQRNGGDAER